MTVELIGVPFDGYGRQGHQSQSAQMLRENGLSRVLHEHGTDSGDLDLPAFETSRGAQTGLLNEPALLEMTWQLSHRVCEVLGQGRFPLVVGGDCSLLLGVMKGVEEALGDAGLMFFDGHEDTMPLDVVEDGEAANCELGLLLGLTGRLLPQEIAKRLPIIHRSALAVLGTRDDDWRRRFNIGTLADWGVLTRPLEQLQPGPTAAAESAAEHLNGSASGWWLHIDLDVLDPQIFGAQGLPGYPDEPGGLTFDQLQEALTAAMSAGGCIGMSVTIYDPAQDPQRTDAKNIASLIEGALTAR